ncbi:MAG: isopenicillin N synthase family oxygenase [Proteobacteria bacterium]|nr:isopenicillin N synthase family oxygenase [Pseudomonadota bacterium]
MSSTATSLRVQGPHAGTASEHIPVFDLAAYLGGKPDALAILAIELREALEDVGFFCVVNHAVPQSLIDDAFEQTRRFHQMPEDEKVAVAINQHHVGYMGNEGELVRSSKYAVADIKPDVGEAFFVKYDHPTAGVAQHNQWPDNLTKFREPVVQYYDCMEALARQLLPIYATALDMPADYFDSAFNRADNLSILRMAHFPPDSLSDNQFNVGPHTDGSFLTLLPMTKVPGLELLCQSGNWFAAKPPAGSIIVNSGDMLTRWTNGRFLSTPHRVRSVSGTDRYSIPFFFQPNPEQVISCLPSCTTADNPPSEPAITAQAYFEWFMQQNFAHAGVK